MLKLFTILSSELPFSSVKRFYGYWTELLVLEKQQ